VQPATILITGGAGFVGSNLAVYLKRRSPVTRVVAFDNLKRRGSELNPPRLREVGVEFIHGDIRNPADLECAVDADLLLECAAEPSVLAGFGASPEYVIQTNLVGTLNLLEYCRRRATRLIFLSTSRVYSIASLCAVALEESSSRFEIAAEQQIPGVSREGITEAFPVAGPRSLYGATKLASELFIEEYGYAYGLQAIINRCGVIAGPWQMGRIDQGFVVLWLARHLYRGELSYIGFNGSGKQVRDVLHIDDLCDLIALQIAGFERLQGQLFNVGGGRQVSVSLMELTRLCREVAGTTIPIHRAVEGRQADVPIYLSDMTRVREVLGWAPQRDVRTLVRDTYEWLHAHREALAPILTA
jgi:CDP-paratose 2-epimerase